MFLVDALLILAMMFFLFLPITDRKTARMKLCMLCALCALFAVFSVSVTRATHVAPVQLAGIVTTHQALQSSHMPICKTSFGFSPWPAWDIRLPYGQANTRERQWNSSWRGVVC